MKPYDLNNLVNQLKGQGLDIAEDGARLVLDSTITWLQESATLSENKVDDILGPILLAAKPFILEQIDKIDGEEG